MYSNVSEEKYTEIQARLKTIEIQFGVKVLYAIESGSRAWGFHSKDSDYDVRFIYVRPLRTYAGLAPLRDVIDQKDIPIKNDLDFEGWDIRKALNLFGKGNPSLYEWLRSPIIYRESSDAIKLMQSLSSAFFRPRANIEHYWHMASGNFRKYIEDKDTVHIKKYLYVIRPILASFWISVHKTQPPILASELIQDYDTDLEIMQVVEDIISAKRDAAELGKAPAIPELTEWLGSSLKNLRQLADHIVGEATVKDPRTLAIILDLAHNER